MLWLHTGINLKISVINSVDDIKFKGIVAACTSYSSILRQFGLTTRGGCSLKVLKKRIEDLSCPIGHFKNVGSFQKSYQLSEILIENSPYVNTVSLKRRLVKEGILKYSCSICSNEGIWMGSKLVLQLDHINGVNNDNRLLNLRLLCPNCHSQTETYSGKNTSKTL